MISGFCTILSKGRLYQAIALFISLYEVMDDDYPMFVLCMDDDTYRLLYRMNLKNIIITHIKDLQDEGLQSLRQRRKLNEFCWTLKPIFIESLLVKYPSLKRITYVDSDLFFFSDPSIIFKNQPHCSILLSNAEVFIPSFTPELTSFMQDLTGKYNSGFISFKNDIIGLQCLKWWKDKCIEKCSDNVQIGSFGDQKYLDFMPSLFDNVCDIITPGVNIGHWNYAKHRFYLLNEKWFIDESELICYHFSGFRIISKNEIVQIYEPDRIDFPLIYLIYRYIIKNIISSIEIIEPTFNGFATEEDMTTGSVKLE